MGDTRPDRAADGCFRFCSRFVLFGETARKETNKKSGNGKHRPCDDEKIRRTNFLNVMLGYVGAEDPTKSAADGDEAIEPFALFNREQIGNEGPEDSGVKQVENTDPNKEPPTNPYLLWGGTSLHCDEKQAEDEDKK